MIENESHIEDVAHEFAIAGEFVDGEEIYSGHINSTYMVTFKRPNGDLNRYILQRINSEVAAATQEAGSVQGNLSTLFCDF